MKKYNLTESNIEELKNFAKWFKENKPELVEKNQEYGLNFKRNAHHDGIGAIIGYKGKTIYAVVYNKNISSRSLKYLTELINALQNQNNADVRVNNFISLVEDFVRRVRGQLADDSKLPDSADTYPQEKNETIEAFENTQFYCYERLLDSIGRRVIKFQGLTKNNRLLVTICPAQRILYDWTGTAYCDSTQDFLIIESSNSMTKSANTNYMIRIEKNCKELDLCIGHMTFASPNNNNVVTKTIVMERIPNELRAEPKEFNLVDHKPVGATIDDAIVRFLSNRDENRLSSPHKKIITNHAMLKKWHEDNDHEKMLHRNEHLLGEYSVFYRNEILENYIESSNLKFTEDSLIISENLNGDLVATYFHKSNFGKPHKWEGDVFASVVAKSVSIFLHGPVGKPTHDGKNFIVNDKPIYLILNIYEEDEFDTLAGIISGIRDNDRGSIGMLAVAVKTNKLKLDKKNILHDLKKFFDAYMLRSWIRPPVNHRITKFADLTRSNGALEEGFETTRIVKKMLGNS